MQTAPDNSFLQPRAASEPERGLRISAVAAGLITDVAVSVSLGGVYGGVLGFRMAISGTAGGDIASEVQQTLTETPGVLIVIGLGLLGSMIGGYVAARMGRHAPHRHAGAMGACSLLLAALVWFGNEPGAVLAWYDLAAYGLTIPAALMGSGFVRNEN